MSGRANGFTVIELMITIGVLGVLFAIGVPAFSEMARNNRTASQTNSFVLALSLARSEATKRGLPVSICAADASQATCSGAAAASWANGWIVFTDQEGAVGSIDAGDVVLQTSERVDNQIALTSNNIGYVRFNALGVPSPQVDSTFTVEHAECTGTNRRSITLARTGRVNTAKVSCS